MTVNSDASTPKPHTAVRPALMAWRGKRVIKDR
jgi:hypothetical protein